MSTFLISHCSGVPGKASGMSTCPLRHCSGVPGRASEYVAASWCVCHAIWLRNLLSELQSQQYEATKIRVDNESLIELARNPIYHERRKHKDVCFHFIGERVRNEEVKLNHVASRDQVADIFTKALPTELFDNFKLMLRMKDGRDLSLREDFVGDKLKSHVN
nr:retrovirus-related Pol polyprotein from transposon TNT 1-94 [Tanacetum cinerariifolium]